MFNSNDIAWYCENDEEYAASSSSGQQTRRWSLVLIIEQCRPYRITTTLDNESGSTLNSESYSPVYNVKKLLSIHESHEMQSMIKREKFRKGRSDKSYTRGDQWELKLSVNLQQLHPFKDLSSSLCHFKAFEKRNQAEYTASYSTNHQVQHRKLHTFNLLALSAGNFHFASVIYNFLSDVQFLGHLSDHFDTKPSEGYKHLLDLGAYKKLENQEKRAFMVPLGENNYLCKCPSMKRKVEVKIFDVQESKSILNTIHSDGVDSGKDKTLVFQGEDTKEKERFFLQMLSLFIDRYCFKTDSPPKQECLQKELRVSVNMALDLLSVFGTVLLKHKTLQTHQRIVQYQYYKESKVLKAITIDIQSFEDLNFPYHFHYTSLDVGRDQSLDEVRYQVLYMLANDYSPNNEHCDMMRQKFNILESAQSYHMFQGFTSDRKVSDLTISSILDWMRSFNVTEEEIDAILHMLSNCLKIFNNEGKGKQRICDLGTATSTSCSPEASTDLNKDDQSMSFLKNQCNTMITMICNFLVKKINKKFCEVLKSNEDLEEKSHSLHFLNIPEFRYSHSKVCGWRELYYNSLNLTSMYYNLTQEVRFIKGKLPQELKHTADAYESSVEDLLYLSNIDIINDCLNDEKAKESGEGEIYCQKIGKLLRESKVTYDGNLTKLTVPSILEGHPCSYDIFSIKQNQNQTLGAKEFMFFPFDRISTLSMGQWLEQRKENPFGRLHLQRKSLGGILKNSPVFFHCTSMNDVRFPVPGHVFNSIMNSLGTTGVESLVNLYSRILCTRIPMREFVKGENDVSNEVLELLERKKLQKNSDWYIYKDVLYLSHIAMKKMGPRINQHQSTSIFDGFKLIQHGAFYKFVREDILLTPEGTVNEDKFEDLICDASFEENLTDNSTDISWSDLDSEIYDDDEKHMSLTDTGTMIFEDELGTDDERENERDEEIARSQSQQETSFQVFNQLAKAPCENISFISDVKSVVCVPKSGTETTEEYDSQSTLSVDIDMKRRGSSSSDNSHITHSLGSLLSKAEIPDILYRQMTYFSEHLSKDVFTFGVDFQRNADIFLQNCTYMITACCIPRELLDIIIPKKKGEMGEILPYFEEVSNLLSPLLEQDIVLIRQVLVDCTFILSLLLKGDFKFKNKQERTRYQYFSEDFYGKCFSLKLLEFVILVLNHGCKSMLRANLKVIHERNLPHELFKDIPFIEIMNGNCSSMIRSLSGFENGGMLCKLMENEVLFACLVESLETLLKHLMIRYEEYGILRDDKQYAETVLAASKLQRIIIQVSSSPELVEKWKQSATCWKSKTDGWGIMKLLRGIIPQNQQKSAVREVIPQSTLMTQRIITILQFSLMGGMDTSFASKSVDMVKNLVPVLIESFKENKIVKILMEGVMTRHFGDTFSTKVGNVLVVMERADGKKEILTEAKRYGLVPLMIRSMMQHLQEASSFGSNHWIPGRTTRESLLVAMCAICNPVMNTTCWKPVHSEVKAILRDAILRRDALPSRSTNGSEKRERTPEAKGVIPLVLESVEYMLKHTTQRDGIQIVLNTLEKLSTEDVSSILAICDQELAGTYSLFVKEVPKSPTYTPKRPRPCKLSPEQHIVTH